MKRHTAAQALSPLLLLLLAGPLASNVAAQTAAHMASRARSVATTPSARSVATTPGARRRRIAALRAAPTEDGTRVFVTSDAPLTDYSARRLGENFYVRIPQAKADATRQALSGRGLASTLVEQVEGDVLLTFRTEDGATARVEQNFNRLEIIFTSPKPPPQSQAAQPQTAGAGREDERLRQVLKRVEELEARVKELEARQSGEAAKSNESHAPADETAAAHTSTPATQQNADNASTHGAANEDEHAAGGHGEGLPTGTPRMQIQGYADVRLRASNEKGRTTSFGLGQLDLFITSRLSENFSVLGELILEAEEDNSFTFSAHRLLLRYEPRDYFALNLGRDHTSIGYYNTAYHHGSWFQTAASRPYLFAFENKGGILPLHNVGVSVSGRIPSAPFGLHYVASVGNGRSANARTDRSVAISVDENNGKAFNLALFARPARLPGFQTGFSVYRDRRTPEGETAVGETIMAAHLVRRTSRTELLNEGVLIRHASGARVFYTPAFYTQFARRFGDARPYFRYQYVNAPDDDPVLRPLEVGRRNGPSAGLRYDVSEFAAFKVQFDRTTRRRKKTHDELIIQLSFTF